jgi:hypothetical protein
MNAKDEKRNEESDQVTSRRRMGMNATWWNWRMAGGIAAVALLCQASPVRAGNEA